MKEMDVRIGLAKPEEISEIWGLFKRTYIDAYVDDTAGITKAKLLDFLSGDSPYFPKNWKKYLEHPTTTRTVYVARNNGKIVGMISPVYVDGRHRITGLYVDPEAQDMGVGTKLMEKALSHYGDVDIYIGIASHVRQLQHFYEHFGFKVIDPNDLKRYPPDPMSYFEMVRPAKIS